MTLRHHVDVKTSSSLPYMANRANVYWNGPQMAQSVAQSFPIFAQCAVVHPVNLDLLPSLHSYTTDAAMDAFHKICCIFILVSVYVCFNAQCMVLLADIEDQRRRTRYGNSRPVRRGGSLGANEPPFEKSKKN